MGFWMVRARRYGGPAFLGALLVAALNASAASAVPVSLPANTVINATGPPSTGVNMTIGTVSSLEAVAISFTFDSSIVSATAVSVPAGSVVSTCNSPVVNMDNLSMPGRVTITLACITPVSGSGLLFTINFQGVANGVSALTFSATGEVPNGCQLNEGTPSCESSDGQITVGSGQPTNTATATLTATVPGTPTSTQTSSPTGTSTGTRTNTPTATDTVTTGPSPTPTQTRTASTTATVTLTPTITLTPTVTLPPTVTLTPSITATVTATLTTTPTGTATLTRTITPTRPGIPVVPSPTSPAGLVMVSALGGALLWALRRLASKE
jgi:hypothetical protein